MNQFDFYKEFYIKELDSKNEINNSLSLPIGLITALVAGFSYLITSFDYKYSLICTSLFATAVLAGLAFLSASIYHLIKAYSNFPKGYNYFILADTNDLANYYQDLKDFYTKNPDKQDTSDKEFEDYVLIEMVKNTGENQKNNKRKNKFRYNCEKHLITAVIAICISLPFFAINYASKNEKKEATEVKIVSSEKLRLNLNSKENRNFILQIIKDSIYMAKETKPAPPVSQVIKEGQDPRPKPKP